MPESISEPEAVRVKSCVAVVRDGDPWPDRDIASAVEGFLHLGYRVRTVTPEKLRAALSGAEVGITSETPVIGGVHEVRRALRLLDVAPPPPIDYPECLSSYLNRKLERVSIDHIPFHKPGVLPLFIKPADSCKAWTGCVLRDHGDVGAILGFTGDGMAVWTSEVVGWSAEWRVFVLHGKIVDVRPYRNATLPYASEAGTWLPWFAPDVSRTTRMVSCFEDCGAAPAAYAIDVGLMAGLFPAAGLTALVEVNDGYALGSYGLDPSTYAEMLEARWLQMTGAAADVVRIAKEEEVPRGA